MRIKHDWFALAIIMGIIVYSPSRLHAYMDEGENGFKFIMPDGLNEGATVPVSVQDPDTQKIVYTIDVPNLKLNVNHQFEYYGGYLYVLNNIHYPQQIGDVMLNTIVRYDGNKIGKTLYSGSSGHFWISDNNKYLAFSDGQKMGVIDISEKTPEIKMFTFGDSSGDPLFDRVFMGNLRLYFNGYDPDGGQCNDFHKIDFQTWQSNKIMVLNKEIGSDCDINADRNLMVTSNFRFSYEPSPDSEKELHKIMLYNFETDSTAVLAEGIPGEIGLRWIDDNAIGYKWSEKDGPVKESTIKIP